MLRHKSILSLLSKTLSSWSEDNAFRLSAALAYYAVFSLAPLLIIVIAIAGAVFGADAARGEVMAQIEGLIGTAGAEAIQGLLQNAARPDAISIASAIGLVSLLFGATGVFASLQDGLDTIWRVKPKPQNMVIGFLRQRLHTFTLVLGIGFLLLTSLVVSAALAAFGKYFGDSFGPAWVWQWVNIAVSLGIVTILFGMMFKLLPDVYISWNVVWVGAVVTAVLFTLGKLLIGLYLGRSSFTSVYGAAGSVVLILAWVYYSSLILFLGAEFTRVYADQYGRGIVPKPNAVPMTPEQCAEQGLEPRSDSQKAA
ncbi:MAG TPA: YihY/virulence factor BrkB family protein [Bryobacteraceae bacterium]|nr:YihY/virulence factor BrkB family protein [Bryobacteraceae bacterium]